MERDARWSEQLPGEAAIAGAGPEHAQVWPPHHFLWAADAREQRPPSGKCTRMSSQRFFDRIPVTTFGPPVLGTDRWLYWGGVEGVGRRGTMW